jgi:hypothetical protein
MRAFSCASACSLDRLTATFLASWSDEARPVCTTSLLTFHFRFLLSRFPDMCLRRASSVIEDRGVSGPKPCPNGPNDTADNPLGCCFSR